MSKVISDTRSLAEIIIKLQDVQKKIKKNDMTIASFLKSIYTSGFQDKIYVVIRNNTQEYQNLLKPINKAMEKFENLKTREKQILIEMEKLNVPK